MTELPDIKPGLCVMSRDGDQILNVHYVRDGQVFYGYYDQDGNPLHLHQFALEGFFYAVRMALERGHRLFTLISWEAPQQTTNTTEGR